MVSTHSRPKAAGTDSAFPLCVITGFNTQPPEGGWLPNKCNSTAACVSTHSRPKAAGPTPVSHPTYRFVSTHSRPKAAGAAFFAYVKPNLFQHTAARRRLVGIFLKLLTVVVFQHTAARRRLDPENHGSVVIIDVSTHSRPKAAGPVT